MHARIKPFCWMWALQGPKSSITVLIAGQVFDEVCDLIKIERSHYFNKVFLFVLARASLLFDFVYLSLLLLMNTFKFRNVGIMAGK